MSINLDNICRVCMEELPNMLDLFEKKPENIANKLFYVTSHKVRKLFIHIFLNRLYFPIPH